MSQSQSLVSSAAHKRVSTFDDVTVSKVMHHASGATISDDIIVTTSL